MRKEILIVSAMVGAENCALTLEQRLGLGVEIAPTRRAGLLALRRSAYRVVVVEENLVEADPDWADQMWIGAGLAVPLQVNFAISGCARLGREIKAALGRRDGEQALARRAAAAEIENELRTSVTGLLLQSELALREPAVPPSLAPKLRHLLELAGDIRDRLEGKPAAVRVPE